MKTIPAAYIGQVILPLEQVKITKPAVETQNSNFVAQNLVGRAVEQALWDEHSRRPWRSETDTAYTTHAQWRIRRPLTTYTAATLTVYVWGRTTAGTSSIQVDLDGVTAAANVTSATDAVHTLTVATATGATNYQLLKLQILAQAGETVYVSSVTAEWDYGSGAAPDADGSVLYLEDDRSAADAPLSVHREAIKRANLVALTEERLGMICAYSDDPETVELPGSGRIDYQWMANEQNRRVLEGLPFRCGPMVDSIKIHLNAISDGTGDSTVRIWIGPGDNTGAEVTTTITSGTAYNPATWVELDLPVAPSNQCRTLYLWVQCEPPDDGACLIAHFNAWEVVS